MSETEQTPQERFREVARRTPSTVVWHPRVSPAETLADLARACADLGVEEWDVYGEHGAVELLEREVAELLGKPAAVFVPSGVMGQQAVLRAWCERQGSLRVALPDLAHLLVHENDGPRLMHGFRFEHLTTGRRTPTAEDLRACIPGLGAAHVELPLREAGCLLPTWAELSELSQAARELGVPLHVDGARLWESQHYYDRSLAEIAALADSVYVSFYKGLGAMAGAAIVCAEEVATEVRGWRQRMGGTLFHLTPYAVSALVGLRERLPLMGEYAAWARALATELTARGLRVQPDPPQTNTFLVYADGDPDVITTRLCDFMEREGVSPMGPWWAGQMPGTALTEVTVHSAALVHDPASVAAWWEQIVRG